MKHFIGIDVGSVTTKLAVVDEQSNVIFTNYLRTAGGPVNAIQEGFRELFEQLGGDMEVTAVATTGSGRHLAAIMVGADVIKNEITAHATAAVAHHPEVRTVIDIGGQDSKLIILKNGITTDFNMNSVCAAGTGSFLDHQATRLGIPIEEFGDMALRSTSPVRIAGRCGVFAESDLIHKQQMGYKKDDLIAGLSLALARNYLTNVARGRKLQDRILFQGGVAANKGIRAAFESLLNRRIYVPKHFKVMGAIGAALLARRYWNERPAPTQFRGIEAVATFECKPRSFICGDCSFNCEINELYISAELVSRWGSRCGKWDNLNTDSANRDASQEPPLSLVEDESSVAN